MPVWLAGHMGQQRQLGRYVACVRLSGLALCGSNSACFLDARGQREQCSLYLQISDISASQAK